jgi:hypothetical protein
MILDMFALMYPTIIKDASLLEDRRMDLTLPAQQTALPAAEFASCRLLLHANEI